MAIRMMFDNVAVLPDEAPKKVGSIHLAPEGGEKPLTGKVIAVGPGRWDSTRKGHIPSQVTVGDRVHFGKYAGEQVEIDGQNLLIMREDVILGIEEGGQ